MSSGMINVLILYRAFFAGELFDFLCDYSFKVAYYFIFCPVGSGFVKLFEMFFLVGEIIAVFAEEDIIHGGVEIVGDLYQNVSFGRNTLFPVTGVSGAQSEFFKHFGNTYIVFLADLSYSFIKHTKTNSKICQKSRKTYEVVIFT